jgi:hypothetical protein
LTLRISLQAFCKGAKLLRSKMNISDCDRIYIRATREFTPPGAIKRGASNKGGADLSGKAKGPGRKGGHNMKQHQFVAALIRLAAFKEPNASTLATALERPSNCTRAQRAAVSRRSPVTITSPVRGRRSSASSRRCASTCSPSSTSSPTPSKSR